MGNFVLVNLILGSWFIFWFIRSQQVSKPNPLKLRARSLGGIPPSGAPGVVPVAKSRPRILNVHFNYSDHMWDAYEVLGVPAGSKLEEVELAFKRSCEKTSSGHEFLGYALDAIKKANGFE